MSTSVGSIGKFDPTTLYQNIFKKVDADGNGSIDKTEFKAAIAKMTDDQDVSSDELDSMFSALDTSKDGKVDETEMLAALKSSGEARHAKMQAMGMMPPPPPPENQDSSQSQGQVKSLQSTDTSTDDVAFSDLISSLKSTGSGEKDEDRISSLFSSLVQDLMNGTSYSQQGSLSVNTTTAQTLLSLYA
jgi:Ca2+-binding EF-hand superfamily protein